MQIEERSMRGKLDGSTLWSNLTFDLTFEAKSIYINHKDLKDFGERLHYTTYGDCIGGVVLSSYLWLQGTYIQLFITVVLYLFGVSFYAYIPTYMLTMNNIESPSLKWSLSLLKNTACLVLFFNIASSFEALAEWYYTKLDSSAERIVWNGKVMVNREYTSLLAFLKSWEFVEWVQYKDGKWNYFQVRSKPYYEDSIKITISHVPYGMLVPIATIDMNLATWNYTSWTLEGGELEEWMKEIPIIAYIVWASDTAISKVVD